MSLPPEALSLPAPVCAGALHLPHPGQARPGASLSRPASGGVGREVPSGLPERKKDALEPKVCARHPLELRLEGISDRIDSLSTAIGLSEATSAQRFQVVQERLEAMHLQQLQSLQSLSQSLSLNRSPASSAVAGGEASASEAARIVDESVDKIARLQEESLQQLSKQQMDRLEDFLSRWGSAAATRSSMHSMHRESLSTLGASEGLVLQDPRASPDVANFRERQLEYGSEVFEDDGEHDRAALKAVRDEAMAMKKSLTHSAKEERGIAEMAKRWVELMSACLIFVNMIWMAVDVEVSMAAVWAQAPQPEFLFWVNLGFAVAFSTELLVKVGLFRSRFFVGPGWKWNVFDMCLVLFQAVDLVVSTANLTFFRVLRAFRAIRAARIIRTVTVVPQLRLMVASIACSLGSLFWSFVLLFVVLFLCAMGIQQTVQSAVENADVGDLHPDLKSLYGTLPLTMLTLFKAISGGADWADLAEPLARISFVYIIVYVMFVIAVVFGMLNILTAVFVEATANIAQVDADYVIQESLENETSSVNRLKKLLCEVCTDKRGTVGVQEFESCLEDGRFRAQLKLLDLDMFEAKGVFKLLDVESTKQVSIDDLVYGLMRLKGGARAMDMVTIIYENKRLLQRVKSLTRMAEANFRQLRSALAGTHIMQPPPDDAPEASASGPTALSDVLRCIDRSSEVLSAKGAAANLSGDPPGERSAWSKSRMLAPGGAEL